MNELRKLVLKSAVIVARVERVLEINTDNQIKIIEILHFFKQVEQHSCDYLVQL